jgi:acyl carrier protein
MFSKWFQVEGMQSGAYHRIRQFLVQNFLFGQEATFGDNDSFLDNGIIDSTGVLELVSFLEVQFGIKVDDEDLVPANLDSLARVVGFVERKAKDALHLAG